MVNVIHATRVYLVIAAVCCGATACAQTTASGSGGGVSADSQKAANAINEYIEGHFQNVHAMLRLYGFNPDGGPEEYEKLKKVLPGNLAAKVELATPAMMAERMDVRIAGNLKTIGAAMLQYAGTKNGALPENLGQVVGLVPSKNIFLTPGTKLPAEVAARSEEQQAVWINEHSIYRYLGAGKTTRAVGARAALAVERPDLNLEKPHLAVLYGDGRVEVVERAKVMGLMK
jgi:hypothetical protein